MPESYPPRYTSLKQYNFRIFQPNRPCGETVTLINSELNLETYSTNSTSDFSFLFNYVLILQKS